MKTVRRLFYVDIVGSVSFVGLAFLSLFFFIDFVDELGDVGKRDYTTPAAALVSLLEVPGHIYELMPIAVLIGTIYALARMAQSSEYTILRTGGLGPGRALQLLASLGLAFGVITFIVGDYIAPLAEARSATVQARYKGGLALGGSGAWLKDRESTPQGERSYSINVGGTSGHGELREIRIFEFDANGALVRRIAAGEGQVDDDGRWELANVTVTRWSGSADHDAARATDERMPEMEWRSALPARVVAAAVLPLSTMSTVELARYIEHLSDNEQAAQRYEIQFWKRALYPFACLVMVALALPFAYLHARAGGVSLKVFGGIMLGISFVLLNNVAGHLGVLHDWTPWIAASTPSLIYLLLSLGAFAWLVKYR